MLTAIIIAVAIVATPFVLCGLWILYYTFRMFSDPVKPHRDPYDDFREDLQ